MLEQNFYNNPTISVAKNLLGKYLVREIPPRLSRKAGVRGAGVGSKIIGQITETEAYCGPNDLASHASRGLTPRNASMFGPPGYWYVYLIYGMYCCLNIVTEKENYPAAVLIRAVKPIHGIKPEIKTDGPGKLCRAFQIGRELTAKPAFSQTAGLWIEDRGDIIKPSQIKKSPRIGIDYAGGYKDKLWRFTYRPH